MQVDSKQLSRDFYNHIGKRGLSERTRAVWDRSAVGSVQDLITQNQSILDVGCGYGRIAIALMKKGFDIYGIDLSEGLIAVAKAAAPRALRSRFRVADMCRIPFKNDTFDVVLCLWSAFSELLYAKEQVLALKEMNRVLKDGGLCFIEMGKYSIPSKDEIASGKYSGHGQRIRKDILLGVRNYHFNHDKDSLENVLRKARIKEGKIVEEIFAGRRRQILKFIKK